MLKTIWLKFIHLPHWAKVIIVGFVLFLLVWHILFLSQIIFPYDTYNKPYSCATFDVETPCSLFEWYLNTAFLAPFWLTLIPVSIAFQPAPLLVDTHLNFSGVLTDVIVVSYLCAALFVMFWPLLTGLGKKKFRNAAIITLLAIAFTIARGVYTTTCPGMDPFTTVHLSRSDTPSGPMDDSYNKDKNHVFFNCQIIPGADPKTFERIYFPWAKDAYSVFYENNNLHVDPNTFVLFRDKRKDNPIMIYKPSEGIARGGDTVFAGGQAVAGVDIKTFEFLDSAYFKDRNHVYWFADPINGADPSTFQMIYGQKTYDAQDKNHRYFGGEIVQ